jgi:hypothetical protein
MTAQKTSRIISAISLIFFACLPLCGSGEGLVSTPAQPVGRGHLLGRGARHQHEKYHESEKRQSVRPTTDPNANRKDSFTTHEEKRTRHRKQKSTLAARLYLAAHSIEECRWDILR